MKLPSTPFANSLTFFLILCFSLGFNLKGEKDYKKLHFDAVVVDAHNDVVQRMLAGEDILVRTYLGHSDLPRFREGGIDVEVFSIWVPPDKKHQDYYNKANKQIDAIETFVKKSPYKVVIAKSAKEIENAVKDERFVVMLGLEGGHAIENDLKKLERFYQRGVRYMSLTWNNSTDWATSSKDESDSGVKKMQKGLTKFGKKIIRKMNELGIMVDVSHVGEKTFWDIVKITKKPIIASHSCVWTLCPNHRNLKDDQIKAIAKTGGIVCISFVPSFIDSSFSAKEKTLRERNKARIDSFRSTYKGASFLQGIALYNFLKNEYSPIRPTIETLVDHIDYIAKLVGTEYVGLGSDFDGISVTPKDMDDVTFTPNITKELLRRGYSDTDIKKILGDNFLRVLQQIEK